MEVDVWSNDDAVTAERVRVQSLLTEINSAAAAALAQTDDKGDISATEAANVLYGGAINDALASHSSFTKEILQRLCQVISEATGFSQSDEVTHSISDARALHSEIQVLSDRVVTLSMEIVQMHAHTARLSRDKHRLELQLARAQESKEASETAIAVSAAVSGEETMVVDSGVGPAMAAVAAREPAETDKDILALKSQIRLLEKQVNQSEADKAAAEMELTERLSKPLGEGGTQDALVVQLKSTVETLRQQCRTQLSQHQAELFTARDKNQNLMIAMQLLEKSTASKIEELVAATKRMLDKATSERDNAEREASTAKAELVSLPLIKAQLSEQASLYTQVLQEVARGKAKHDQLVAASKSYQDKLETSRSREVALEETLRKVEEKERRVQAEGGEGDTVTGSDDIEMADTKPAAKGKKCVSKGKKTPVPEEAAVVASAAPTVIAVSTVIDTASRERAAELLAELNEANASIDDFILEVESLNEALRVARQSSTNSLELVKEGRAGQEQSASKSASLTVELGELHHQVGELQSKLQASSTLALQQDSVISNLVDVETKYRSEVHTLKQQHKELEMQLRGKEMARDEAEQSRVTADLDTQEAKRRSAELKERCTSLVGKVEHERKCRMTAAREARAKQNSASGSTGGAAAGADDEGENSMLNMTLGMLRCSVCRDRFKEVAITRCFHLFCRECIDINLANRHRKCPACGERFGADDVKQVYFTH